MEVPMKKAAFLLGIVLLAACTDQPPAEMTASDQTKLNAALANYEQSGPPVSCVIQRDLGGNKSVGEGAIIFEGKTSANLWVNRPPAGCPPLDFGRALVTHTTTGQLCSGDIATVLDPVAHMTYGGCGLGEFTPYRRVRR
jgi:hypothetical protein